MNLVKLFLLGVDTIADLVRTAQEDVFVQSDEKNIQRLLKSDEDHTKFQNAVQRAIREREPQEVTLNGKNVTISI